ncbi:type II toxin-antitoxin system HigB family toxin [Hymenobacter siberiensis]|uniref:type II toxin-antitoxin system HigB family toxin n=1 Tax=Hymenobacter siberiensis TaxID=2848396 RepID=UPI001C1E7FCE|nr:type II toxin-antitoxin system HigB family toxin [Hymenobacter siberiensis]MBU6123399.1 type II toxin-antitoxin system HigB family toxin [Hymenobacter siberiensis]
MVIISQKPLRAFWEQHPDAKEALSAWYAFVQESDWAGTRTWCGTTTRPSTPRDGRYVFNIRGNRHLLVVRLYFATRTVFIRFVGTHQQYDHIDADTV